MTAYAYIRVSTERQEDEGYSLPAQENHIIDYAKRLGFSLEHDHIYREAKSAKKAGRKVFNKMLEKIQKEKSPVKLLVDKTDRLGRNNYDHYKIELLMEEKGLQLHIVKENKVIDKNSPPGEKLLHGINVALAKHYVDNLSQESKKGMHEKARQGWMPGNVPYGYKNNKDTREIDIVSEQAIFVKRAYELCTINKYSLVLIRDTLFQEGFMYKPDKPKIHLATLHGMLTNRFYTGQFKMKGEIYDGKHVPIISIEDYKQAVELFKRANRPKETKQKEQFIYSGLLICADCGCSITAQIQKMKYVYYHCTNYHKKCKSQVYVREERLTEQFANALKKVQLPDEYIPQIIADLKKGHKEEIEQHQRRIDTINRQVTVIQNRLKKLLDVFLEDKITHQEYIDKQNSLKDESAQLEFLRSSYTNANFGYVDKASRILELAKGAYDLFLSQSAEEKRNFINLLLLNCKLDGENLRYDYNQPFDMFYKMTESKEWWRITELNCRHKDLFLSWLIGRGCKTTSSTYCWLLFYLIFS